MKTGFVSIVGRPNVGKSTIFNALINKKISIVTDKSQTTRNNIKGILTTEKGQIIFLDTPGIHESKQHLGKEMNKMAFSATHSADVLLFICDASKQFDEQDQQLINHLDLKDKKIILVFNKIDLVTIDQMKASKELYLKSINPDVSIECVAIEKFNIDQIIDYIYDFLPEGPLYYEPSQITDADEIFICKEYIREQLLLIMRQEIPHCCAIYIENFEESKKEIKINAIIYVEKESQKGIVIGSNGQKIKEIGIKVRKKLEKYFNKHILLELYVKVDPEWRNNDNSLKKFGYLYKQQ